MLGRHILIQFAVFQKSGLLAEIGHFEVFSGIFGVTDLTLGHPRVAPEGFFLLYYPYPVPKLLAEAFLGLGPDLVHLIELVTVLTVWGWGAQSLINFISLIIA